VRNSLEEGVPRWHCSASGNGGARPVAGSTWPKNCRRVEGCSVKAIAGVGRTGGRPVWAVGGRRSAAEE
jgi:hypothetical protein